MAIQRTVASHARMLDQSPAYARAVARVRGLGFAGTLTEGTDPTRHHLASARGDSQPHHH